MFTRSLAALAATAAVVCTAAPAFAQKPDIVIPHGQTTVFSVPEGVDRVVVGDATVAEVVQLPGGRDLLINGKAPGFTNFLVWPSRGPIRNYKLEVLSSRRDETIAVRIQVIEATQRNSLNAGVKWAESVGIVEAPPSAPFRFGLPVRNELLSASLKLLAQDRDIKVLAQPTLVIQNGKKGEFLAGGELPIPLAQATGGALTYSIEWKQFGVKLEVEPRLEGNNSISMALRPEVSSIDMENAIQLQAISVPAISTRWAKTNVQIQNGESIVIAGLMRNDKTKVVSKLPLLGDIPLLGNLFAQTNYDERVSELVFIVTPQVITNNVVKPEQDYTKPPLGQPKK